MDSNTQFNTSQNILDEEDFLSNYADDFLFDDTPSDEQQQQNLITTLPEENTQQQKSSKNNLIVLLKQAKGRDDQFESVFPPSLLCHPYKYDLKIIGELENGQQAKLTLNLVDAETLTVPNVSLPNKKIVEGVSVEQIEETGTNERVIRFTFNLCSFHFKRRPFKLELTQVIGTTTKRLFLSNAFQTFARRREHHQSFNSNKSSDKHATTAPLTPDSSSNSSGSASMQSPKMEKQGVKRSISSVNSTTYYPLNKTRNIAPSSPSSSIGSPTILNPHFAAHLPMVYPANLATVYHPEMAQQFALQYAPKMQTLYYPPQWAAYPTNQIVFGSPNTSPISPPSNVIPHQDKSSDILGTLITGETDKKTTCKKDHKIIHHTPLNFVHAMPAAANPVVETSERASIAIQFLQSLTPVERQTVTMFMNGSQAL